MTVENIWKNKQIVTPHYKLIGESWLSIFKNTGSIDSLLLMTEENFDSRLLFIAEEFDNME